MSRQTKSAKQTLYVLHLWRQRQISHHRNYRSYDKTYGRSKGKESLGKGHMIETGKGILHSEVDSEATVIKEGHIEHNYSKRDYSTQQMFRNNLPHIWDIVLFTISEI